MSHGFHDYTVSSAFERFVDGIERALTELLSSSSSSSSPPLGGGRQGPVRTVPRSLSVAHSLPFRKDAYALTHLPGRDGEASLAGLMTGTTTADFVSHESKYHDWFLRRDCIVLEPESYSRRILTSEEYHTVVSAVAVALDNLLPSGVLGADQLTIPVYVPRHDARRDACGGLRKVMVGEAGGSRGHENSMRRMGTQWFECDSVHGRVDEASAWMGDLSRRLEMMAARLHGVDASRVRGAKEDVVEALISGEDAGLALVRRGVLCASKRTFHLYRKSVGMDGSRKGEGEGNGHPLVGGVHDRDGAWDRRTAWAPWVSQDDPVGGVEADLVDMDGSFGTEGMGESSSSAFAKAVAQSGSSLQHVSLFAMDAGHTTDTGNRSFLPLQVEDVPRTFLRCVDVEALEERAIYGFPVRPEMQSGRDGFASRLHACLRWYRLMRSQEHDEGRVNDSEKRVYVGDVLEDAWWIARAGELGVDVESAVAKDDVDVIVEDVITSLDDWKARSVCAMDVVSLYAATIPESLRGVLQVWKASLDAGVTTRGHLGEIRSDMQLLVPSRAMVCIFIGLFRASLAVLEQSPSDTVRRQVKVLRNCSKRVLDDLADSSRNFNDVDASLSPLYGISNVLGCIEHTAAAAASLHQRLAGVEGGEEDVANRLVEGMIANAMRQTPNVGHKLLADELEALVGADDRGHAIGFDGPVSIEHVIEVVGEPQDTIHTADAADAADAADGAKAPATRHRMYVSRLPSELRVATSIVN